MAQHARAAPLAATRPLMLALPRSASINQPYVSDIAADADAVYWLERGIATQATGQISRRRR